MEGEHASFRLDVLGPIRVTDGDVIGPDRPAHKRLLAILALADGSHIHRDVLIDRFWGSSPPATARAALQTHMSGLRKTIGADTIQTSERGYRLAIPLEDVDSHRFDLLAAETREATTDGDRERALGLIGQALGLWRGEPYMELRNDEFAAAERTRLSELRLELVELRAELLVASGRADEVLADLEALVLEHPYRERLWESLMRARYQLGRNREALRAFRDVSGLMAEVGLEPGENLRKLEDLILAQDLRLAETRNNLPTELSNFVGREAEIAAVADLLVTSRLVTLAGPGGSGKTRLGLEVAHEVMHLYPDGVWFVELASTEGADLVGTEMVRAIGLKPSGEDPLAALITALSFETALILLDNCEHVLSAAATAIRVILESCPGVRVLATSRQPLRVPGETVYDVPGMRFPVGGGVVSGDMGEFDAVSLFEARALQADPSLSLDSEALDAIVDICRRVDGMPLAIELAAARARSLELRAIADRLTDRIDLLAGGLSTAPPRQQTLRATIDWSYRLLSETEKLVLGRLSVFRGGFQLEAAETVVCDEAVPGRHVAANIADLVTKSLVAAYRTQGGIRYRLLEVVRQYSQERLQRSGAAEAMRTAHLAWCVAMTDHLWERALGGERAELFGMLSLEADNLQAAMDWANGDDPRATTQLSQALGWHWYHTGHLVTAAGAIQRGLDSAIESGESALSHALLGWCRAYSEDLEAAQIAARVAYAMLNDVKSPLMRTWVVYTLQSILWMTVESDPRELLELGMEAEEIGVDSEDLHAEILGHQALATGYCWNGNTLLGLEMQRKALDLAASTGDAASINQIYGASIYNYMLDRNARRVAPRQVTEEWQTLVGFDEEARLSIATDWLPWVYMQSGDFSSAEEAVTWMGNRTLEGYNRTIHLIAGSTLDWMRGDLERAWHGIEELDVYPDNQRFAHTHYPLVAEVAADRGDIKGVEAIVDRYMTMGVHVSREATKLGVLGPLVRAHVDAGIREGTGSSHHSAAARALDQMVSILERHPPLVESWLSIMTHEQNLLFAEAEFTRLSQPSIALWERAASGADYAYYIIYARWRLAEALLYLDDTKRAVRELGEAHREAVHTGARLMQRRIAATARSHQIPLG